MRNSTILFCIFSTYSIISYLMLKLLFMKRTKERYDIDEEDEERRAMFAGSISDAMKHQGSRFIAEPSYVNIENLTFGRLAFHGMNPVHLFLSILPRHLRLSILPLQPFF